MAAIVRPSHFFGRSGLCRTEAQRQNSETLVDAHGHALAALRYLGSKLDARQMARLAG
jgi:hypothetical protein